MYAIRSYYERFGHIVKHELAPYRGELIISSKAGYYMWPGPYGEWGSRKYLIASCDQSLKRMGLEYVDIFYHHRPDPDTPLEETMAALDFIVRSGKALYAGISNYRPKEARAAIQILHRITSYNVCYTKLLRGVWAGDDPPKFPLFPLQLRKS